MFHLLALRKLVWLLLAIIKWAFVNIMIYNISFFLVNAVYFIQLLDRV